VGLREIKLLFGMRGCSKGIVAAQVGSVERSGRDGEFALGCGLRYHSPP
jgi:hypothetical protein